MERGPRQTTAKVPLKVTEWKPEEQAESCVDAWAAGPAEASL